MANFSHFLLKIGKNVYKSLTSYPQCAIVRSTINWERDLGYRGPKVVVERTRVYLRIIFSGPHASAFILGWQL